MPRRQAAFGGGSMTYKESSFPWSRLWLIENDREDGMRCSEDQARAYRGRVTHAAGHSRRKAQLGVGGSKTDAPLLAIQMRSKGDAERVSKNQSRIVRPPCVGFSLAPPSLKHGNAYVQQQQNGNPTCLTFYTIQFRRQISPRAKSEYTSQ